jgi:hypothetical protein
MVCQPNNFAAKIPLFPLVTPLVRTPSSAVPSHWHVLNVGTTLDATSTRSFVTPAVRQSVQGAPQSIGVWEDANQNLNECPPILNAA